jgi:hypothetical protein
MSAWWTSKKHIDLIVTSAIALKLVEPDNATETGKMLRMENARSLICRYNDEWSEYRPQIDDYVFRPAPDENLLGVFLALRSYGYQSCETVAYPTSTAGQFVERMSKAILVKLGLDEQGAMKAGQPYAHGENGYWSYEEWPELIGV